MSDTEETPEPKQPKDIRPIHPPHIQQARNDLARRALELVAQQRAREGE